MKDDLEKTICGFLNWWDDYLEEHRFPEGDQEEPDCEDVDYGECVYPVTYEPEQRALVAQLCDAGCCTSVRELDGLVEALRELMGRQAPEQLPPDNDRLFRFSEDDRKVWEAEFSKAHPDAFHEDARGPGDWERIREERAKGESDPLPGARRAGQLPAEESAFWDEIHRRVTNREAIVLWNIMRLTLPAPPAKVAVKRSELTAELEHWMSRQTCERAIRMLRRRGLVWERPEGSETWVQMTSSGTIVARRMTPR